MHLYRYFGTHSAQMEAPDRMWACRGPAT
jgi:hypothetical protein